MTTPKKQIKKIKLAGGGGGSPGYLHKLIFYLLNIKYYLKALNKSYSRTLSYGSENPDKRFYIIGPWAGTEGLLSLVVSHCFFYISYALDHGYIPVIDLQNHITQYHGAQKENIWEYFFEQPCGYTLTDIRRSRHIILSPEYRLFMPKKYAIAHNAVSLRHKKLFQKYIRFNKETRAYLEFDYKKIVKQKNRKVLGVLCRGTDYIKRFNLPIQPDPQVVLQKARRVMLAHKCTHLYLATEDEAIYKLFLAYFGKKLLTNRQRHFDWSKDYGKKKLLSQVSMSNAERRQIALDYLSSLNILARCPCFIGGNTAGTSAVYLMSQGFEYDYLWDLGLYPLDILGRLSSVLRH